MRVWIVIALLSLAVLGWGQPTTGGRMHRMGGQGRAIRLMRELIYFQVFKNKERSTKVHPDRYRAMILYSFRNDGSATSVTMGFPESGGGTDFNADDFRQESGLFHFHTWLDGRRVKAVRRIESLGEYCKANWVTTVSFARHQQRTVRVTYVATSYDCQNSKYNEQGVEYDFTGGHWKGVVGESDLRVSFHLPGTYIVEADYPLTQQANTLFHRWKNWQATEVGGFAYYPTRADGMVLRHASDKTSYCFISTRCKGTEPPDAPAIIKTHGVMFISLPQLHDFFDSGTTAKTLPHAELNWDEHKRAATFIVAGHTLQVMVNNRTMRVDGHRDVILPARPFLNAGIDGTNWFKGCFIYIPLRPIVRVLGCKAKIDSIHRVVTLTYK